MWGRGLGYVSAILNSGGRYVTYELSEKKNSWQNAVEGRVEKRNTPRET